jgi:lipopolysaccharide export system protein LptC
VGESDKKLETELLYWDRVKDLVYTERFVKITREDEIIMGTGFESNSRFDSYTLKNTSATIYR